ncbi:MAG: glycosyltransferase family 4 protein [Solirubrobacterales bacterium]
MRVLVFHGYLLRGTGSNIYNANLAQALARLGHDVHLLCQDRGAADLDWVDALGTWKGGRLAVRDLRDPEGPGSVTAYLPEIGGLLPVYVADHYEGFRVKAFEELSGAELDGYLAANVAAVADVAEAAGGVEAALANHLVMGPVILARSGLGFAAKVHGSALEYTVKPNPRFLPFAAEGMEAASTVLVGSRHTAESLWAALPGVEGLEEKTRLGPPGVDVAEFAPAPPAADPGRLEVLAAAIEREPSGGAFGREPSLAAPAIRAFAQTRGPRVVFVGKLIVSKGVDLLLAAWPMVHAANPGAGLLVVGFGEYREALRRLLDSLAGGDLGAAREVARRGRALEGGEGEPLPILSHFLEAPPDGYPEAAAAAAGSVGFAGRLEHREIAELLPFAEALVMPSTFPEAFGMVAVEAAACGVLPVSAGHSGMLEVSRQLAPALPEAARELISFPVAEGAVEGIAARLNRWLEMPEPERAECRGALVERARELWSWEGVARCVIAASRGERKGLPRPEAL